MTITPSFFSPKRLFLASIIFLLNFSPLAFLNAQCASPSAAYAVDITQNNDGTCTFNVQFDYENPSGGGNSSLTVTISTTSGIVLLSSNCIGGIKRAGSTTFGPFTSVNCSEGITVIWTGRTNPFCGGGNCGTDTINTPPLSSSLPVELIDFTAEEIASNISLYWTTASEVDNAYFAIEHSTNGKDFFEIGIERGQGTTSSEQDYVFVHDAPGLGNNYYRLRQVDVGEVSFEYSKTIVVKLNRTMEDIRVYPTATSGLVYIDFSKIIAEPVEISLIALNGAVLLNNSLSEVNNLHTTDLSPYAPGLYHLRIYFVKTGDMFTKKVIRIS